MLELRERDLDRFFAVPFAVYGDDVPHVSPMRSDLRSQLSTENPLFPDRDGFLPLVAVRDGAPVGRIVVHVHEASNRKFGLRRCSFGYFDCADDPAVAGLLLGAAEEWARRRGCDEIAGCFDLTAMQQLGVVVEGFDRAPYTDMRFNPPWIPRLLEEHDYEAFFPTETWETDLEAFDPDSLLGTRQRALLEDRSLRWTSLRRRGLAEQMEHVRHVLNDGFAENPMFVPLTPEEIAFQAREMMWIVDERISCLVFEGDRPIGVVVCIPDLNPFLRATRSRAGLLTPFHFLRHRFRRRRAVILFYSVCRDHHGRGLAGAMLHRVTRALRDAGYRRLGTTWIAEENVASRRQMEKLGARRLHRLRLFRKGLEQ